MDDFNINEFLENYSKVTDRGRCKICSKQVTWNRKRVASHKRTNCTNVSAEERSFFTKRKFHDISSNENSSSDSLTQPATIQASSEEINAAVGNFFYRSGISFRIADSPAWKHMIKSLNPSYSLRVPSAKSLSGTLLDKQYEESRVKIAEILSEAESLTLTSDGWTNVRGEHIVNFIIKAPGRSPFFYKSIETSGIPQDREAIANAICDVIVEIGVKKICSVITDNAPVMQAAWKIIENRYPTITAYGCAAHGMNLVIKDIVSIPEHSKTIRNTSKIIQFINNHHLANAKFEEKRKEAGVSRKLSTSVPTRWYSQYTSATSVLDAKVAIKRIANEDFDELGSIHPKPNSLRALNLMKSEDFWDDLELLVDMLEFPTKVIG